MLGWSLALIAVVLLLIVGLESTHQEAAKLDKETGGGVQVAVASGPEPDAEALVRRLRDALAPFQTHHLSEIGEPLPSCAPEAVRWQKARMGVLSGCPHSGCASFISLAEAKEACSGIVDCGGVTHAEENGALFECRLSRVVTASRAGETSWVRSACKRKGVAEEIWEAFRTTMEDALDDRETLHLDTVYTPRRDDSIYVAISSYRDPTCEDTVRNAFREAEHPEKVFVGIVQQNCNLEKGCYTGTGWGDTRQWKPQEGPVCLTTLSQPLLPRICTERARADLNASPIPPPTTLLPTYLRPLGAVTCCALCFC